MADQADFRLPKEEVSRIAVEHRSKKDRQRRIRLLKVGAVSLLSGVLVGLTVGDIAGRLPTACNAVSSAHAR
ncbi:uncharacterized protein YcfJ [Sphingomonas zeicaulis]|uniref:hypothetical protein n=1 Tax=Sphingomonas zeicaulis TaxID=1632740 RepID=UPI003D1DAFCF